MDIGVDGVRDVGKGTMKAQLPGPGLRVVWKVDGRIRLKIELGLMCVWRGAILHGEVAQPIVLKGPFVLASYDSLC